MSDLDIPVLNWFEEPIKDSIKSVFSGVNAFVESLDIFNKYKKTHFEMLRQQVGSVKILGMQQPMALKELYYPATISTDIRSRLYAPEWNIIDSTSDIKRSTRPQSTELGDSYVSKNKRVVVLGGPGAGKTTFLKFLALAYSDESIFTKTKLKHSQLPIYIHLPLLAREGVSIVENISALLMEKTGEHATEFYTRALEHGTCTVFLDSLDEVPQQSRQNVIDRINKFATLYPKCGIILSCRTADYHPVFTDFSEIELARLTKEAVITIVKAWFGRDREKAAKLLALLENDKTVSSLTETPLLLSLLCIQFKNDLTLPKKRTELYRRCVDALIRDWDTTRGFRRETSYSSLSDERKEKLFEAIAGKSCTSGSIKYELSEPFVLDGLANELARFSIDPNEAKGILAEIENHHGILEKCSVQSYEFSHGTMQEYFAARYFVAKRMELDILKKNYGNEDWHNIIMFMASIMDDPSDLLGFLVVKSSMEKFQHYPAFGKRLVHLLLLYRCLAMGVSINPLLRAQICEHLVKSQIDMLAQLNRDGILPFAARIPNGVRQALFYYKKSRSSLAEILRPYRSLMNEIVLSPVAEYAEKVAESVNAMTPLESPNRYEKLGTATCILAPISEIKPEFFFSKMIAYSEKMLELNLNGNIRTVLQESISIHTTMYPEICTLDRRI